MLPKIDVRKVDVLRELVNSNPVFSKFKKYSRVWNILCVFMDRIQDSATYLAGNDLLPEKKGNTTDLITYLVYTSIITDCIKQISIAFSLDLKVESNIFGEIGDGSGNDDKYFNHIRALTFAHPLVTSHKSAYVEKGEILSCPYIINGSRIDNENVSIMVYSNIENRGHYIKIEKIKLIEYLEKKYNQIDDLIEYLNNELSIHIREILENPIECSENPEVNLHTLLGTARERFDENTEELILDLIDVFDYEPTSDKNKIAVNNFRKYIEPLLPSFLDCYSKMAEEFDSHLLHSVLTMKSNTSFENKSYVLEKIRGYLNEELYGENVYEFDSDIPFSTTTDSNVEYGFMMLRIFKEELADCYVDIEFSMPFPEIQILVSVALFMDSYESC